MRAIKPEMDAGVLESPEARWVLYSCSSWALVLRGLGRVDLDLDLGVRESLSGLLKGVAGKVDLFLVMVAFLFFRMMVARSFLSSMSSHSSSSPSTSSLLLEHHLITPTTTTLRHILRQDLGTSLTARILKPVGVVALVVRLVVEEYIIRLLQAINPFKIILDPQLLVLLQTAGCERVCACRGVDGL